MLNDLAPSKNSTMYLDDDFRPITETVGLIAAPADAVAAEYKAWMDGVLGRPDAYRTQILGSATLSGLLTRLLPAVRVGFTRLVVAPVGGGWSAVFNNGWRGTDVSALAPVLAKRLSTSAISVTCAPQVNRGTLIRYGARLVTVFGGDMKALRAINVANDGGRWVVFEHGAPLPEEDPEWMAPRRKRDRFREEHLRILVDRLVPGVWELDKGVIDGAVLIEQVEAIPENAVPVPFDEVQAGIPRAEPG